MRFMFKQLLKRPAEGMNSDIGNSLHGEGRRVLEACVGTSCVSIALFLLFFAVWIVEQSCEESPISIRGIAVGAVLALAAGLFVVLSIRLLTGRAESREQRRFSFTAKWIERLIGLSAGDEDASSPSLQNASLQHRKSIAQLVTTTWGWSLVGLFAALVLAYGILWSHPFYQETRHIDRTDMQNAIPFLVGAAFWVLWVAASTLVAVFQGRRYCLAEGSLSHVRIASRFLLLIAAVISIFLGSTLGAVLATIINSFLLLLCLIYVSISVSLSVKGQREAWLHTAGIAASIVRCWVR